MWTRITRGRSSRANASSVPPAAGERHVAHLPRRALGDPEAHELVVAPERAVDEHHVACGEAAEHFVVEPREAR